MCVCARAYIYTLEISLLHLKHCFLSVFAQEQPIFPPSSTDGNSNGSLTPMLAQSARVETCVHSPKNIVIQQLSVIDVVCVHLFFKVIFKTKTGKVQHNGRRKLYRFR